MEKKVYISGPITGRPDARDRFHDVGIQLADDGYIPVSPYDNGLDDHASWNEHMIADIRMLIGCDAIFMMKGWMSSKGARIEYNIAEEMDMGIIFESLQDRKRLINARNDKFAKIVKAAIREVMGTDFDQHDVDVKTRDVFFMRMIFTYHCRRYGMKLKQIKTYVHRDHTTMLHYLKRYNEGIRFDPDFRKIADAVSVLLSKFVSE